MQDVTVESSPQQSVRRGRKTSALTLQIDALEVGQAISPLSWPQASYHLNRSRKAGRQFSREKREDGSYRIHRVG